ncbi:unnamed protein product [Phyllotreta striolata]|uniref:Major facilitator superfamily domain-containing protein 9-like protein n=1 Tax=Phyllotreta striolata TaxID=444603 RepID=K9LEA2_PHYSR|nr:major facilitator superfamily domain-containing protein 9-like protein [Phyllotreta striolata]CAG9863918.1 unnamed protein product [Phyllotreta striolata]
MEYLGTIELIYIISFLDLLAVGAIFPVFTQHLRDLGASHTTIGIFASAYSAIQVVSGPLIGSWSDIRDRKTVLKATVLSCSICYTCLALSDSLTVIFVVRFLLAIVKHTQTICKAIITDLIPLEEQGEFFAKSVSIGTCGFIIGPLIGGNLAELQNGFSYVCAFTAGLFLLNYILACYISDDLVLDRKLFAADNLSIWQRIKSELKKTIDELSEIDWSRHWHPFLLKFILGFSMACYFSNQGLYLRETYNLSQKHAGYMISYFSIISIVAGLLLKKIHYVLNFDNIYTKMILWYGVLTLSFILLYFAQNFNTFVGLLIPLSMSSTAMRVVTMELMFQNTESFHKGSLSGASNSIMSIARFVTPLFTGVASDIFGEKFVMLLAAIPASIGLIVSWILLIRHRQRIKEE